MSKLVAATAQDELLILPRGKVRLHGIDFDENFLSELVARHFRRRQWQAKPMFSAAYGIYMRENPSAHRRKFKTVAQQAYALFVAQFGDMPLVELRHVHITEFRNSHLARGLRANSVRRHINMLNAMVNMRFKHLDIDRLSPFRRLYIRGIPHLWVRKNSLTDRKTQASIRCVPLRGVSLKAAQELHHHEVRQKSEWLMPQ
jgi:hypothetical protein